MKIVIKNVESFTILHLKLGYSCRSLAVASGIGETTLQKSLSNSGVFSPRTAKKIVDVLQVQFDDIFEIVPSERKKQPSKS